MLGVSLGVWRVRACSFLFFSFFSFLFLFGRLDGCSKTRVEQRQWWWWWCWWCWWWWWWWRCATITRESTMGFSVSLKIFPKFRHMRSRVGFPDSFSFPFPSFSHAALLDRLTRGGMCYETNDLGISRMSIWDCDVALESRRNRRAAMPDESLGSRFDSESRQWTFARLTAFLPSRAFKTFARLI